MANDLITAPIAAPAARPPLLMRSIAVMKPVTWFAPSWAFLCGGIASNAVGANLSDIGRLALGMLMAGPILCGLSQVVNDYCDRDVDAINEPYRPIPSGLVSHRQVFVTIAVLIVLASAIALFLGERIVLLAGVGMLLAVLYSAYPVRAKRNGWVGNALVALSYEGLPWLAGHLAFATLSPLSLIMAGLYSFGTHGIMTINDFKSIDGDRRTNIKTIPVLYGPHRAALTIILTMTIAQVAAAAVMLIQGRWWAGGLILVFFLAQIPLQRTFLRDPITNAVKFSAGSSGLYVLGMLVAAIGV